MFSWKISRFSLTALFVRFIRLDFFPNKNGYLYDRLSRHTLNGRARRKADNCYCNTLRVVACITCYSILIVREIANGNIRDEYFSKSQLSRVERCSSFKRYQEEN